MDREGLPIGKDGIWSDLFREGWDREVMGLGRMRIGKAGIGKDGIGKVLDS